VWGADFCEDCGRVSIYRETDDLRPRLRVLEELRACDRVVAGALATIATADAMEPAEASVLSDEGPVDLHRAERAADRAAAARELMGALESLRRALAIFDDVSESSRQAWPQPSAALRRFGRTVSATGIADELQTEVRSWFDALRGSDPRIAPEVRALPDWESDEPLALVEPEPEVDTHVEAVELAEIDPDSAALVRWHPAYAPMIAIAAGGGALGLLFLLARAC
jgi:hypothetical protein